MSQPNRAHSIHERLLKVARSEQEEFQNLLMRYARERWLYRLSLSAQSERFVLKGAMLFALWSDEPHRLTQDLDLLGFGGSPLAELEAACREVCAVQAEEDGLQFLPESVKGAAIREENIYDGVRLTLRAMLGKARIPLQIDIGFGNSLTIRGEGPGLSWDQGLPMDNADASLWTISIKNATKPVTFKVLVNDLTWSAGPDYVVEPGQSITINPTF